MTSANLHKDKVSEYDFFLSDFLNIEVKALVFMTYILPTYIADTRVQISVNHTMVPLECAKIDSRAI